MGPETRDFSRREFLHTAAIGAAALAAAPVFSPSAKEGKKPAMPAIFVCGVCGHVEFGAASQACPVCHASKDNFARNDSLFDDTRAKFPDEGAIHVPIISIVEKPSLVPDLQSREISVRIGKTMHVMEMEHYIKYIDVYLDDNYVTRFFVHTQIMPAISIYMKPQGKNVRAVEWCTIHGYWQAEAAIS